MSGWEPVEVTRYEYDGDGRVVGSVTTREPEWCRADVEALLAFIESGRVGPHGHPLSEAMSRDGDPSNPDATIRWHVPLPSIDFAQQALDREKRAYAKKYPDADMNALRWRVEKQEI